MPLKNDPSPRAHAERTFADVKSVLMEHVKSLFPVVGLKHELRLKNIEIKDDLDPADYASQKDARMAGKRWSVPVKAELSLVDVATGKVINTSTVKLIDLPRLTNRGTYIVGGTEYAFPTQKRLKSGAYVRTAGDGILRTQFNLAKGRNFELALHPTKGHFQIQVGTTSDLRLYPILIALGATDGQMMSAWGKDVVEANRVEDPVLFQKTIQRALSLLTYDKAPATDELQTMSAHLRDTFNQTQWDTNNVKVTLGKVFNNVTADALIAASSKMLRVARGESKEDDRESLVHNDIVDLSDFIVERFRDRQFRGRLERLLKTNVDRFDKVADIIPRDAFQRPVDSLMTESAISRSPTQGNPLGMISDHTAITVRGEGGIQENHALTRAVRALDPSHLGFLDPAHTPEGEDIGTTLHLTTAARKQGKDLITDVFDVSKGKVVAVTPQMLHLATVAFPDFFDPIKMKLKTGAKIRAMRGGEIVEVSAKDVDYAFLLPEHLFDTNSNAVPFLNHNNGVRLMTAAKMGVQSRSLIHREAPQVQVEIPSGLSLEHAVGHEFSVSSPIDGTVVAIDNDYITIKPKAGIVDRKPVKVSIPNHFPLNSNNHLHADLKVKVGDEVHEGKLLADTNFTKDGVLAQGTNLKVAYVPYKGMNFEDGVVVSEAGAQKLTSEHIYQMPLPIDSTTVTSTKRYQAYFPTKLTVDAAKKLDDGGVIRVGEHVQFGDVLVAALRPQQLGPESQRLRDVSRSLAREFRDSALTWEKQVQGTVVDVARRSNEIVVHVRTEEPARVGDKITGRYGNKGIIIHVVPDKEMPRDEKGAVIDLILNPNGVIGRMNLGQIMETTASKVAGAQGRPYMASGFAEGGVEKLQAELKKHGLKDHETIHDPVENKDIPGILVGHQYIYKLEHQATKKISARGGGPDGLSHGEGYTAEMQPAKGSGVGGRAIGTMETYALLAHGADQNIAEMFTHKSDFNPDVWRALESGAPLPPPKPTFSQAKFVNLLKGMGVNVEIDEKAQQAKLVPFLDKDVIKQSSGKITNAQILRGKDMNEIPGGLFDPKITGGMQGDQFAHIVLPEPVPSPAFEKPILSLLHWKSEDLNNVMTGQKKIDGLIGGKAVRAALKKIDVQKRLAEAQVEIKGKNGADLNRLHSEIRYLKALKETNTRPEEYVIQTVPVVPPKFRPVYTLPDGNLRVSDVNYHYQGLMQLAERMRAIRDQDEYKKQYPLLVHQLWKAVGGIQGIDEGIIERKGQDIRGIADTLAGVGSPKGGYVHSTMLKRRQDLSATAVATVNPALGVDEIGLPEETAWAMFRPFIVRELRTMGYTPLSAKDSVEKRTPQARQALDNVMRDKHVIINRAPTLHKFSVLAMKPKLVKGYAVQTNPFIVNGLNLDYDGDTLGLHVPMSAEANAEAAKMLPSNHLYKPGTGQLQPKLGQEYVLGLYRISTPGPKGKPFDSVDDAIAALNAQKVEPNAVVTVKGIGQTTPGRCLINSVVPKSVRDYSLVWTAKATEKKLIEVDQKEGRAAFSKALSALADVGRRWSYLTGASFLLSDLQTQHKERDRAYAAADMTVAKIKTSKLPEMKKREQIVKVYQEASQKLTDEIALDVNQAHAPNNITEMMVSGARGSRDQVKQLVSNIGVMQDHEGRPMPVPVKGTYTEGLATSDYWQHMYGARKGMIDKSQSVKDPGALTKQMIVSASSYRVLEKDCGTKNGVVESTSGNGALDRFAADSIMGVLTKNQLITTAVLSQLRKKHVDQVKVRSPITCATPNGVCVMCYGLDEEGHPPAIGDRVGIKDVHALTEPSTQLALKQFHTGGVATGKASLTSAFDRVQQLFEMPESLRGHAVVSEVTGMVASITPNAFGGHDIVVGEKRHRVPADREVIVTVGQKLAAGDPLSAGAVRPQDTLRLKGLRPMQIQLRDDIQKTFADGGVHLKSKAIEPAVRLLTDTVRVTDSGTHPHLVTGDYTSMSQVEAWNGSEGAAKNQTPVNFVNVLPGSEFLPHKQEDWAHRIAHNRIRQVLSEAPGQAQSASLKGPSPFASLLFGKPQPKPAVSGSTT
jgi:DNA-directed RNA polymerase subunit beta'